ncbi:MAG: LysM peptidoglycan-binding domain-containing protein [Ignavibacteria bacterium]|nr:LysM peptidoglycan-binding domain-containing protein [Ignavibacteria bacterium]
MTKINILKYLKSIVISGVLIISINYLSGCSSSEEITVETYAERMAKIRAVDSVNFYGDLSASMGYYQNSLSLNNQNEPVDSKSEFEKALKVLRKINKKFTESSNYSEWNKDYEDLARNITMDYLTLHKDIDKNSNAFYFTDKLNIDYEKIVTNTYAEDTEIIPGSQEIVFIKNEPVIEYLDFFSNTSRGQSFVDKTLYRSGKFFPMMRKILKYHGVPEDLVFLSVQESGLNPTIVSRAGAVGLWQFMPSTGAAYGLYSDSYRDDRRDFEKSTDAAARHLKDLFRVFGDWYLAFAAYNAGQGRIQSAVNKAGSTNFWDIRSYLPGETKNYVPSILALSEIFRNPAEYGFKNVEFANLIEFDRVNIVGTLTFDKVAEFSETDVETIRGLNTELTADVVPNYNVPYQLRIPKGSFSTFEKNYKNSPEYDTNGREPPEFAGNENKLFEEGEPIISYKVAGYKPDDIHSLGTTEGKEKIEFLYMKGKSLSAIADSFGVRPVELRLWNDLKYGSFPKDSSLLAVYLSKKQYNKFYGIVDEPEIIFTSEDTTSVENEIKFIEEEINDKDIGNNYNKTKKPREYRKDIKSNQTKTIEPKNENTKVEKKPEIKTESKPKEKRTIDKNAKEHIVREGDSLGQISIDYGLSIVKLMEWNNLENDKIIIGQKLRLTEPEKKKEENKTEKTTKKPKGTKITHIVKSGENLTVLADKYGVKTTEIIEWNELQDDKIMIDQKLIIYSLKETAKTEKKKEEPKKKVKQKTYKVKKGDSLSSIADKFGVSIKQLKSWNKLKSDKIQIDQVLKVSN